MFLYTWWDKVYPALFKGIVIDFPPKLATPGGASPVTKPTSRPPGRAFEVTKAYSYSRLDADKHPMGDAEAANFPIFDGTSDEIYYASNELELIQLLLSPLVSSSSPGTTAVASTYRTVFDTSSDDY